jgi:CBS domain containing-hemolysin-like protein
VTPFGGSARTSRVWSVVEIVGEIGDEYDAPRELPARRARRLPASARTPVVEVNERFGWNLPRGEGETLAGVPLAGLGCGEVVVAGRPWRATARAEAEGRIVVPGLRGP